MLRRLLKRLTETQRQFIAFCIVGGVGFVVDAGTLSLMVRVFEVNRFIAGGISMFVFGMTTTWLLNRNFTFRSRRQKPIWLEYVRFALANGFGNLMNYLTFAALVATIALFQDLPELAKVAGTAVGLVFNFTSSKYFVFRKI